MQERFLILGEQSSLRIGGKGTLIEVDSIEELKEVVLRAKREGLALQVIGAGTNSYFGDDLSKYLFVRLNVKGIVFENDQPACRTGRRVTSNDERFFVTATAGESFDDVVIESVTRGLWGLENLSYIPGSVGASPVQNIGAYGRELRDVFVSLSALDTETNKVVELDKQACEFGYRDSVFKKKVGKYIIISVTLLLSKTAVPVLSYKPLDKLQDVDSLTSSMVREKVIEVRKSKLPDWREYPNAGSFFKNPVVSGAQAEGLRVAYPNIPLISQEGRFKIPAAWLIDNVAEMKGVQMGNLGTWGAQPLVIVNYGTATFDELNSFVSIIQQKILENTGILLEQEVNKIE